MPDGQAKWAHQVLPVPQRGDHRRVSEDALAKIRRLDREARRALHKPQVMGREEGQRALCGARSADPLEHARPFLFFCDQAGSRKRCR